MKYTKISCKIQQAAAFLQKISGNAAALKLEKIEQVYIIFEPNNSATVMVGMCSGGLTISNFMA
jgi:hypothetical protein